MVVCAEVFDTCMTHALTTEKEEIMGLLLGDIIVRPLPYQGIYSSLLMKLTSSSVAKDCCNKSKDLEAFKVFSSSQCKSDLIGNGWVIDLSGKR